MFKANRKTEAQDVDMVLHYDRIDGFHGLGSAYAIGRVILTLSDKVRSSVKVTGLKVSLKGKASARLYTSPSDTEYWTISECVHLRESRWIIHSAAEESTPHPHRRSALVLMPGQKEEIAFRIAIPQDSQSILPTVNTHSADCAFRVNVKYEISARAFYSTGSHPNHEIKRSARIRKFPSYNRSVVAMMMEDLEPKTWIPFQHNEDMTALSPSVPYFRKEKQLSVIVPKKNALLSLKKLSTLFPKFNSPAIVKADTPVTAVSTTCSSRSGSPMTLRDNSQSDKLVQLSSSSTLGKHVDFEVKLESRILGAGDPLHITFRSVPRSQKRRLVRIKVTLNEEWGYGGKLTGQRQVLSWECKEQVNGQFWKRQTHMIPIPEDVNPTLDPLRTEYAHLGDNQLLGYLRHQLTIKLYLDNGLSETLSAPLLIAPFASSDLDMISNLSPELLPSLPLYTPIVQDSEDMPFLCSPSESLVDEEDVLSPPSYIRLSMPPQPVAFP